MTPEISVILCVRNGEATLRRQLDALEQQQTRRPFELLIVENGSTDGTAEVITEWLSAHDDALFPAEMVDASGTPGIPAARNAGIRRARGRIFAFCDADDAVVSGWVEAFGSALEGLEGLAGGRMIPTRGEATGILSSQLVQTAYMPHVSGASMAVTREACEAVGGFDVSLPPYGFDDVAFSWRVQEEGYPILWVPEAAVRYTVSGGSASVRKRFRLGQGRVLMARRFPRYDSHRYTLSGALSDAVRDSFRAVTNTVSRCCLDRKELGRVVAEWGRVYGCLLYRGSDAGGRGPRGDGRHLYIATNNGDISGGEVMLFAIARAARAEGWNVSVIAPRTPDDVCRRADAEGFEVIRLAADSRPTYILQLARWAARHRRAWIWCNGLVPSFALIGHRRRVNHLHQVPRGSNRLFARLIRAGGRRSLVPSDFGARATAGTVTFHNWTEQVTPGTSEPVRGREVRIGFLGRLSPSKGVTVLAKATALLRDDEEPRLKNLRLVIVGGSGHISEAEQREVEHALADLPAHTVVRCGQIRPAELFAQIDLLVVPSNIAEVFGLTAVEAMSAGLPVVVSDDGALPEIVGSDYPWIARKGDAEDLARVLRRAVVTVTEDPEETRRITERARKRWEALFSASAGQARVATILRRIESGATPVAPLTEGPHER